MKVNYSSYFKITQVNKTDIFKNLIIKRINKYSTSNHIIAKLFSNKTQNQNDKENLSNNYKKYVTYKETSIHSKHYDLLLNLRQLASKCKFREFENEINKNKYLLLDNLKTKDLNDFALELYKNENNVLVDKLNDLLYSNNKYEIVNSMFLHIVTLSLFKLNKLPKAYFYFSVCMILNKKINYNTVISLLIYYSKLLSNICSYNSLTKSEKKDESEKVTSYNVSLIFNTLI